MSRSTSINRWLFSSMLLCLASTAESGQPIEPVIDPVTGLLISPGWELASAHCGGCHSHRLVTAQRGDAEFWRSTIRWMQKTQNLWQIPSQQEQTLISYLAKNYNETDWGRRPALAPSLRPPGG